MSEERRSSHVQNSVYHIVTITVGSQRLVQSLVHGHTVILGLGALRESCNRRHGKIIVESILVRQGKPPALTVPREGKLQEKKSYWNHFSADSYAKGTREKRVDGIQPSPKGKDKKELPPLLIFEKLVSIPAQTT